MWMVNGLFPIFHRKSRMHVYNEINYRAWIKIIHAAVLRKYFAITLFCTFCFKSELFAIIKLFWQSFYLFFYAILVLVHFFFFWVYFHQSKIGSVIVSNYDGGVISTSFLNSSRFRLYLLIWYIISNKCRLLNRLPHSCILLTLHVRKIWNWIVSRVTIRNQGY